MHKSASSYKAMSKNKALSLIFTILYKKSFSVKKYSKLFWMYKGILQKLALISDVYHFNNFKFNNKDFSICCSPLVSISDEEIINEKHINDIFKIFDIIGIKNNSIIFDIGANFGSHSFAYALYTQNKGNVFSFEPFMQSYKYLQRNIENNKFDHVKVYPLGFSDKEENLYLGMPSRKQHARYYWDNLILEAGLYSVHAAQLGHQRNRNRGEICNFIKFDEFINKEKINRIDFIKIDTEGHEFSVLKGSEKSLKLFRPVIQIELNSYTLLLSGTNPKDIVDFLKNMGYSLFYIKNDCLHPFANDSLYDGTFSSNKSIQYLFELYCLPR